MKKILIIDDEKNILTTFRGMLEDEGYQVSTAPSGSAGLTLVRSFEPEVVFLDIWMPEEDGISVLEKIRKESPQTSVVMMSGHGTIETAVKAIRLGAWDYLEKPIHSDKVLVLLDHVYEVRALREQNKELKTELRSQDSLVGNSAAMKRLRQIVSVTAPSNGWVLVYGENGVGKELVARALHRDSTRASERFVAVNCAAIPAELIESELFGHEKGSFTGAMEKKIGKFELAHKGTLFLDEVGDMSLKMQAKILRALQEGQIQRVGGDTTLELDLRVIAATNKDLKQAIRSSEFREDLFYRLNVIPIIVAPLRERREDIAALANHFLKRYNSGRPKRFSAETLQLLQSYPWPGNVRELKNWVERACILCPDETINASPYDEPNQKDSDVFSFGETSLRQAKAHFEKQFLIRMLAENDFNISRTAHTIGVERSHLHKKIKSYGIEVGS
ncbi:MAG: sigma-54-dependent Fis family transcriptional regulator [Deltaproteobacteria bacterium]|nr:sigma-54-dependent Fis family transcriptional regulator [Deltaproteobacteria bacterium]MBI3293107.1 sigma-54-dependent Fis family transcriptional regulator [Deltaproteobacteria bacterium]